MSDAPDAIVVGSGPNGLAAAVTLADAGLRVHVYEGATVPGGGARTSELTLPGFRHDVCSAAHPLALASPFFRRFDLEAHGVRLLEPEVQYAHPLDGGRAGFTVRSVAETAAGSAPMRPRIGSGAGQRCGTRRMSSMSCCRHYAARPDAPFASRGSGSPRCNLHRTWQQASRATKHARCLAASLHTPCSV